MSTGPPNSTPKAAFPDTFYLCGGPNSLDGRFETATGEPDWQGWHARDLTDNTSWQISTFNAANLDSLPDNHAMWAGRTPLQEPDWQTAPGYGNSWDDALYWIRPVEKIDQATTVRLRFVFNYELEPMYDFFSVRWDSAGTWLPLLAVDGTNRDTTGSFVEPAIFDQTIAYTPYGYAGFSKDEIRLRLQVTTDGGWSDEDGLFESDGAVQVDDVQIWIDGLLTSSANFEPDGSDGGWFGHSRKAQGNYAKLLSGFDDQGLDLDRDNFSPALTIVDDGTPPPNDPEAVPSAGTTSNWSYGFPGGWVVDLQEFVSVRVASPAIPWDHPSPLDDGLDGLLVQFDVWKHWTWARHISIGLLRGRAHMPGTGWSGWSSPYGVASPGPAWVRAEFDLTDVVAVGSDSLQFALDLEGYCEQMCNFGEFTPDPVIDNFVVVKFRQPATSVPASSAISSWGNYPNPSNPATTIRFELDRHANVSVRIHDSRGSLIRRLVDRRFEAGLHSARWDGRDDSGSPVASGVYLFVIEGLGRPASGKITLVR